MTDMCVLPEGLVAVRDLVRGELRRTDAKATALLSLVGATLAGVIALSARPMPGTAMVMLWCSTVPIASAVLALLAVIRPRFGGREPVVGSWVYAAQHGPDRLLAALSAGGTETV